jgi:hypothetical protein
MRGRAFFSFSGFFPGVSQFALREEKTSASAIKKKNVPIALSEEKCSRSARRTPFLKNRISGSGRIFRRDCLADHPNPESHQKIKGEPKRSEFYPEDQKAVK